MITKFEITLPVPADHDQSCRKFTLVKEYSTAIFKEDHVKTPIGYLEVKFVAHILEPEEEDSSVEREVCLDATGIV